MKMGMVFDITQNKAIILTNKGDFLTRPSMPGWKQGDLVPISAPVIPFKLLSAAVCLIFLCTGMFGLHLYSVPAALISIDVNPALELELNRFGYVVSATAINEQGLGILSEIDLLHLKYQKALSVLLDSAALNAFFNQNSRLELTVFSENEHWKNQLLEELQTDASAQVLSHHSSVSVTCHAVDSDTVEAAHSHGVTAGKYLYLKQLLEKNPDLDLAEYSHHSIEDLQKDLSGCEEKNCSQSSSHHTNGHHHP